MAKVYKVIPPAIPSGNVFYFTTDSGIDYEVRFGRKQDNFLNATIVFGVLNEEYEGEEYAVTNRGEMFSVMSTIVEIVKIYIERHPSVCSFEFTGEPNKSLNEGEASARIKLFSRYLDRIFPVNWKKDLLGNKIVVNKLR